MQLGRSSLFLATVTLGLIFGAQTAAAQSCKPVRGHWSSAPNPECTSPVGMCTLGTLHGRLHGGYDFTMATLTPAPTPQVPGGNFYTGTSIITTHKGALTGTDMGSIDLNPFGLGKFTALLTLHGGTDHYAGATGYLQIRGTLDFNTGGASGDYRGLVCTP